VVTSYNRPVARAHASESMHGMSDVTSVARKVFIYCSEWQISRWVVWDARVATTIL